MHLLTNWMDLMFNGSCFLRFNNLLYLNNRQTVSYDDLN